MTYHHASNGGMGPPSWPMPAAPANGNGKGLFDLAKGGLPLTLIGGAAIVFAQVFLAIGQYQERGAQMAVQLAELKADVRAIKEALPEIRVALKEIAGRPPAQWSMHVEGKRP